MALELGTRDGNGHQLMFRFPTAHAIERLERQTGAHIQRMASEIRRDGVVDHQIRALRTSRLAKLAKIRHAQAMAADAVDEPEHATVAAVAETCIRRVLECLHGRRGEKMKVGRRELATNGVLKIVRKRDHAIARTNEAQTRQSRHGMTCRYQIRSSRRRLRTPQFLDSRPIHVMSPDPPSSLSRIVPVFGRSTPKSGFKRDKRMGGKR